VEMLLIYCIPGLVGSWCAVAAVTKIVHLGSLGPEQSVTHSKLGSKAKLPSR
jgi:hypothetical protein